MSETILPIPTEFSAFEKGNRWIAMVTSSLGLQPTYLLTPEIDSNSQRETAVYFLEQDQNDSNNHRGSQSTIALTITRNVVHPDGNFSVDLRLEESEREKVFYHPHISKITVNPEKRLVSFLPASNNGFQIQPVVSLSGFGEIKPGVEFFQIY